ncbi:unnamed protein product [Cercopithifilaria johnstoni]|uniref:XLF-like N-terminal domain-containing protein n=1 Tax=Cercopithifilaria johnstoni TaxID=2874296 RepID=A0A8J2MKR4_9BILA|nr:unnamed protein product [Cercopithifilaria johnstoni]
MDANVNAELLKICWAPLGFKLANKPYAAKFHVKAEQLHIILTDYECIYYEIADFVKKFSSLNAKLGGPEKTLLEKVRNMFLSPTTKVSDESKNDKALEFNLEIIVGKRTLKWHFFGQHLNSMDYVFSHITRPLLNILSVIVDGCDLSSINAPVSNTSFSDLFGKPSVQKLYEVVTMESMIAESIGNTNTEDGSEESMNIDTGGNNHDGKSSTDFFPATPPPTSTYEVMSDTDQDKEFRKTQTMCESPVKKPRLRF